VKPPPDPTAKSMLLFDEPALARLVGEEVQRRLEPILAALAAPATPSKPDLLKAEQLADMLQVDKRSIRRLLLEGALPFPIRLSDRIHRWRRSDIDAWLESGAPPLRARRRAGSCVSKGDRRS
jgi:predicted DNA-binding transcriptional regulator AlpA